MLMEMCMRDNGWMIRQKGTECILIWMEQGMKDSGRKTSNMGRDKKHGLMGHFMMETISMERSMEEEFLNGLMVLLTEVISTITISMVTVHTSGRTEGSLQVTGVIIKCMERVCLHGQMVVDTKVAT
jgi:hypothetical protein